MKHDTDMTIGDCQKLVSQLKAENNPSNNELIAFYERKISEAIDKAFRKVASNIFSKAFKH